TQPIEQPGVACLAPKRPHSQTKATDSSSLTAGQTSQSVNGYVQESDTGIAKLDSNNNNDNAPASLVYLQNNGQLVPVVAMPQTPPNYIDDIVAVENDGVLSLLLQNIMSVGQDVKTILRNQENFHMRLSALEGERNALAPEGGASISLPLDTVEDFKEKEEQLSNDAVANKQLVLSLSLMGGSKVYDTIALMLRSLMSKELRLQFTAQIPKEGKMVFKNTNFFQVVQAIPVPLFPAAPCPECSKFGVLGIVVVTSNSKAHRCSVVTKDELFELNAPVYKCNQHKT
ncbi:Uncharacterized protein APZ42_030329, partial [Daphnia magna]